MSSSNYIHIPYLRIMVGVQYWTFKTATLDRNYCRVMPLVVVSPGDCSSTHSFGNTELYAMQGSVECVDMTQKPDPRSAGLRAMCGEGCV